MAGKILLCRVFAVLIPFLIQGCGQDEGASGSSLSIVNGHQATAGQFPAAVRVYAHDSSCSGAKVGEQQFLVASHCAMNETGELRNHYQPGAKIRLQHGETAGTTVNYQLKVVATHIHPGAILYAKAFKSNLSNISYKHLYPDVAVLVVDRPTPNIQIAKIKSEMDEQFLEKLREKDSVVLAGWGLIRNPDWQDKSELPVEAAKPDLGSDDPKNAQSGIFDFLFRRRIVKPESPAFYAPSDDQLNFVYANISNITGLFMNYVPRKDKDTKNYDLPGLASGDSGGAAYLNDGENLTIIGVNSIAGMYPMTDIRSMIIRADNGGPRKVGDWLTKTLAKPVEPQEIKYNFEAGCYLSDNLGGKDSTDRIGVIIGDLKLKLANGMVAATDRMTKAVVVLVQGKSQMKLDFKLEKDSMITSNDTFVGVVENEGITYRLGATIAQGFAGIQDLRVYLYKVAKDNPHKFNVIYSTIEQMNSACRYESLE